jgi:hypothetical protein
LKFGESILVIDNVRYIPSLTESIYSLFVHIQSPGHAVHSSFTDGLSIIFPDFESKALIGPDDIYLNASPLHSMAPISSVSDPLISSGSDYNSSGDFCRHVTQFQADVSVESSKVDNLLSNL